MRHTHFAIQAEVVHASYEGDVEALLSAVGITSSPMHLSVAASGLDGIRIFAELAHPGVLCKAGISRLSAYRKVRAT